MGDFARGQRYILLAFALTLARPVGAQQRDEEARTEYNAGKAAYEQKNYEAALEHFTRSYTLSGAPVLLYNIASAQQGLNRPGAAADTLREFLKARPNDPERANIEERIAALARAQALLEHDQEEKRRLAEQVARERDASRPPPADRTPGWLTTDEADRRLQVMKEAERKRRRKLVLGLGLGLGLGLVAVGAITVGVVCGTGHCSNETHDFDYGPFTVTR